MLPRPKPRHRSFHVEASYNHFQHCPALRLVWSRRIPVAVVIWGRSGGRLGALPRPHGAPRSGWSPAMPTRVVDLEAARRSLNKSRKHLTNLRAG